MPLLITHMSRKQPFAISSTVKAPSKEVLWFLRHHLEAGASHIYLWLDNPNDPLRDQINDIRITVTPCDNAHWMRLGLADRSKVSNRRSANAVEALRRAREAKFAWLAVIDYDEVLHAEIPLPQLFDSIPANIDVLRFPVWEGAVTQPNNPNAFEEIEWFKPYPVPLGLARCGNSSVFFEWISFLLRLRIAYLFGVHCATRQNFITGHRSGKSAYRTHLQLSDIGSHGPGPFSGKPFRLLRPRNASVLHYDACDFTSWKNKWEGRLNGNLQWVGSGHRHAYMQRFIKARDLGNEELLKLFMKTKGINPKELKTLNFLKLIVKVSRRLSIIC